MLDLLDLARRTFVVRAGRVPLLARWRRERGRRLLVISCGAIVVAFVLAVAATAPLLAFSPIFLGIPHVASDVRYLLARDGTIPQRARRPLAALFAGAVVLGALGLPLPAALAAGAAVLWAGLAVEAPAWARMAFVGVGALAGALALGHAHAATVALAQGHNLVAIALAGWLVHRQLRAGWIPAALLAAGAAAIIGGACDGLPRASIATTAWTEALAAVVPAGVAPTVAARWVTLFAFAQAVHYSAWLHLVPDAERAGERPPSFRRSFQLLCADLGPAGARAVVVLSMALPLGACLALDGARHLYIGLAVFHGFVELAFLAAAALRRAS